MYFSRPSAERRRVARGVTLLEVMVSQTIAIVVVAALSSLVVAMVQKLNSETNVSDAQVRLRQATHLLLRDTQGIGGDVAAAGDLLVIDDGGSGGPDQFTLFKRDESVCGGGVGVTRTSGTNITMNDILRPNGSTGCPVGVESVCEEGEIEGRTALIMGPQRSIEMQGHNARENPCKFNFPGGQQESDVIAAYNDKYGASVGNINQMLDDIFGTPTQVLFGSSFTYRLSGTNLQRSTDAGATFVTVLDNVLDLQVERIYNINGTITPVTTDSSVALPAGASNDTFLGIRIGIITFGRAADGMEVKAPAAFSNRNHPNPPGKRRYRASFIFAAARNRAGA